MDKDKYLVTEYRGFEIFYDGDKEKFVCDVVMDDDYKSTERGKLKDVKTFVDQFIKKNADFKPFKVMNIRVGYGDEDGKEFEGSCNILTVSSVRKDGALVLVNEEGRKYYYKEKTGSYDNVNSLRVYSNDLLEIEQDWKLEDERHEAKRKELRNKAKPFIKSIDTEFIKNFID